MKTLLLCTHKVNRSNIRREAREGVEHIIIRSFTLPPDIVMNDIAYLTEDRDKAVELFNRTPVTIEHPELNGHYVTASDPEIDMNFRFGAWNENAHITNDNRVALDKVINVQKALLVPQGKRLLDRIKEIEANKGATPLHTSIGVYIDIENVEPATNGRGQEYSQVARNLYPDHDAILLDNVGASTPDQGTGIFPNDKKENIRVVHYNCDPKAKVIKKLNPQKIQSNEMIPKRFDRKAKKIHSNAITFRQIFEAISDSLGDGQWLLHDSVDFSSFVYESSDANSLFKSNYSIVEGKILIQDVREPVERIVEYKTINTAGNITEGVAMRNTIIAKLVALGITANAESSDAELLELYEAESNKAHLETNKEEKTITGEVPDIAGIIANALKPFGEDIAALKTEIQANKDKETDDLVALIVSSKKFDPMSSDVIKNLPIGTIKDMAANCKTAHGLPNASLRLVGNEDDEFKDVDLNADLEAK